MAGRRKPVQPNRAVRTLPSGKHAQFSVVAIGASAGGLQAITAFLRGLPPGFSCPILIVIHQHPAFVSHAAEILGRCTQLRVKEAARGERIAGGVVYIAPPDLHLLVSSSGAVELARTPVVHFSRPSVDTMFASVAAAYGPHCIGVVLSGSGRDGADGLAAIKTAGGFGIVEDPRSARFNSMPAAAMAHSSVDRVIPIEQIAGLITQLTMLPEGASLSA